MLIPFATARSPACAEALAGLALPNLRRLLARLVPGVPDLADAASLSAPHERALARAYGLPVTDGRLPFAAWEVQQADGSAGDDAWAWLTPCHWKVGRDHVLMTHPHDLQLDADDSARLLEAMQPYFTEDGLTVREAASGRWLARGDLFRDLDAASLDRVVGRHVDAWMPRSPQARPVRRLQQEMQMLLYTHPVNEERASRGLLPVNSFWVSDTGALPPGFTAPVPTRLQQATGLRDAALLDDWAAWADAWRRLDAHELARLVEQQDQGLPVQLTLCGEVGAQTWASGGNGLLHRVSALWRRPDPAAVLQSL